MAPIAGVCLQHIAREADDPHAMALFYQEVLGFNRLETPNFGAMTVIWMSLPPSHSLHLIGRESKRSTSSRKDPSVLPKSDHLAFRVENYNAAVQLIKDRGIEIFEKTQQDGKIKQAFFYDPEGNGIEIGNWPA
ncbi:uncharacterized protein LOC9648878 [Selaginella moellendorffii]|uniref:uncharacterized protein LOC9648878 n=1 Tax=Selaginella moellendorffii TaxID=88036 RepID=UPI000D1CAE6E|nr:uncharacterized protein LOC9648878 [Selaginella moellendorffii]|eukprot:XP_024516068.1 uncharacterized protein LOC9648878 [Selaginella moellendorffii]